jgi:two-component system, NtrC family, sensor kinase
MPRISLSLFLWFSFLLVSIPLYAEWEVDENKSFLFSKTDSEILSVDVQDSFTKLNLNDKIIYFEDSKKKESFRELILSGEFKEFQFPPNQSPNFGYSESVFWGYIRFSISPMYYDPLILSLDYPLVDTIQLDCVDTSQKVSTQILGDQVDRNNWKINFRKPSFLIPKDTKECWFRAFSLGSNQFPFTLYSNEEFQEYRLQDTFLQSLFFGSLISIFLYNLFLSITTRSILYLLYCFYLLSFGLFQASFTGISFLYLWPKASFWWINYASIILISFVGLTSYIFINSILELKKYKIPFYKISIYFILFHILHIFSTPFLSYKVANYLVYFLLISWFSYISIVTSFLAVKKNKIALYLFLSWIVLLLGTLLSALQLIGAINSNFFTKNGSQIGAMLEFILLSLTMGYRYKEAQDKSAQDLKTIIEEKNVLLKQEKERREKQIELLQALENEKENAKKAYLKMEASQNELIKSDRMITLGSMVAGVAHEINTPLGAIKANSENILYSFQDLILLLDPGSSHLSAEDWQHVLSLSQRAGEMKTSYSTKEMRAQKKVVQSLLSETNFPNPELLAEDIIDLGLSENLEVLKQDLNRTNFPNLVSACKTLQGIQKKASVIQVSSERVSKIVKSLKSFMHFEDNEEMVLSNLKEGIETVLTILQSKIKNSIEVIKNYDSIPSIYCYPDELNQIWTNLIHNAIQAMQGKGIIQISLSMVSLNDPMSIQSPLQIPEKPPEELEKYVFTQYISVTIEDNGPGIPPEIQKKIFEPFFTTKKAGEGSGLGLHILQKILSKHKGFLELHSIPAQTRFTIYLPARLYKLP